MINKLTINKVMVNQMNRQDLGLFARALVHMTCTTDQMFAVADSIQDQKLRKYFVRQLQKQIDLKRNGLENQITPQQTRPPRSAQFALLLIPKRNREHLIGDLEEEFNTVVLPQHGRFLARCWYFEQVALAIGFYLWPTMKKVLGLSVILKLIGR